MDFSDSLYVPPLLVALSILPVCFCVFSSYRHRHDDRRTHFTASPRRNGRGINYRASSIADRNFPPPCSRLVNLAVGVIMVLGGISQFIPTFGL